MFRGEMSGIQPTLTEWPYSCRYLSLSLSLSLTPSVTLGYAAVVANGRRNLSADIKFHY